MAIEDLPCKVCAALELEEIPEFRSLPRVTSDCLPFRAGGRLLLCRCCGAAQSPPDTQWFQEIGEIYTNYRAYHQAGGSEQHVLDPVSGEFRQRSDVLLDRLDVAHSMPASAKVLDVGCGKAFLLYEMKKLLPGLQVTGFDISKHGLAESKPNIRPYLFLYRAQDAYPFGDKQFDLVISLGTLHNLRVFELETAVKEIERVGKNKYIMVEGYRSELELFNLECWALTAESLFHTSEWIWLYNHFGYTGDYEFIYFE